jgi:prophage antirepressor-like protein
MQFLILLVAEFGCFVLIFMGALIVEAAERFSGWVAGL